MSFNVNWYTLETDALRDWTTELLTGALNSGTRPNILASDITIKDLNFGKIAPEFEILEIGELDKDRFRGIFKINYDGDFHLTLHTQVQANPLKIHSDYSREREVAEDVFVTPEFLLSTEPFNIPLDLKLSDIKISGIGIIVFSQTKGLTLVFRNDPLDSIKVSSTFDTVQVLSNFLQTQIETQIRDLFRETLPTLIHKYSLKYTSTFQNNDFLNNIKDHLKDQPPTSPLDVLELESVASSNLKKLAKLYNSRETLELKVPKIKNAAQRNRLEKFNKDYYPSLTNSLYSNLGIPPIEGVPKQNNGIPVELLVNNDFRQVNSILKEISTIQTKSLRSGSGEVKRAKRRIFKLGKKVSIATNKTEVSCSTEKPPIALDLEKSTKQTKLPDGQKEAANVEHDSNDGLSDTSTVHEKQCIPMEHPTPVKLRPLTRSLLYPSFEQKMDHLSAATLHGCPSPLNTNSSFVGGVGLGSSFFNIAPGNSICGSPLRNDPIITATQEDQDVRIKKSTNRVNIEHINEKLKMRLGFDGPSRTSNHDDYLNPKKSISSCFENPPPPYYQAPRAGL